MSAAPPCAGPPASAQVEWIRKIYKVEAEAKKLNLGATARHALRQEKSLSLLDDFNARVLKMKPTLGKTSKLAQAARYASNQRAHVDRCFTDGRVESNNGEIERLLKKPCVGRKNYLHCGSGRYGARSAWRRRTPS